MCTAASACFLGEGVGYLEDGVDWLRVFVCSGVFVVESINVGEHYQKISIDLACDESA